MKTKPKRRGPIQRFTPSPLRPPLLFVMAPERTGEKQSTGSAELYKDVVARVAIRADRLTQDEQDEHRILYGDPTKPVPRGFIRA